MASCAACGKGKDQAKPVAVLQVLGRGCAEAGLVRPATSLKRRLVLATAPAQVPHRLLLLAGD